MRSLFMVQLGFASHFKVKCNAFIKFTNNSDLDKYLLSQAGELIIYNTSDRPAI